MRIINKTIIITAITLIAFSATSAFADTTQENITLSRISNILNAVYPLIAKAKKETPQNTRVKFQYNWLQKDIEDIQSGIAQKINASDVEPRVIAPLKTHYIEQQNSHIFLGAGNR